MMMQSQKHASLWNPAAKEHMIAYDKQLKDFTTIYDEETILYEGMRI
jgi:hypothetical protein